MTERILGAPGKKRRRRLTLFAPLALLAVASVMLVAASAAPAINTVAADYSIEEDTAGGRNDEPGQKDLTLQGTDTGDLPTAINVLWNWDETSVGGGNSLDGCTLFDADDSADDEGFGLVDFAFCAIVGNVSNQNKTLVLKSTVLYTCGDDRNDRCSQPITIVGTPPRTAGTDCQLSLDSATNPFGDNDDTRIFCTVVLNDIGVSSASLINTCSYPSQQPNSDPSDCVVVPGKASPTINTTNVLIPQDSATLTGSAGGTGGTMTFKLYKDSATNPGVCDATELVFSQTDSTSSDGFKTNNTGAESSAGAKDGYTVNSVGTYLWLVEYSGTDADNPATQACGTEQFTVSAIKNT